MTERSCGKGNSLHHRKEHHENSERRKNRKEQIVKTGMIPFKWYPVRAPDGERVWCMMARGVRAMVRGPGTGRGAAWIVGAPHARQVGTATSLREARTTAAGVVGKLAIEARLRANPDLCP